MSIAFGAPIFSWLARTVARQAAASVFVSLSLAASALWALFRMHLLPNVSGRAFLLGSMTIIPCATLIAAWVTTRLLGARLSHLISVIDRTGPDAELARIRALGSDEVGAVAQAINRLLARITSIRASMIDQQRELGEAQRELKLKADLAAKTDELARRLEERAMLFDILRVTSSNPELSFVLSTLVERVGQLLHMREVVLFLFDEEAQLFSVEAVYGLSESGVLKGRTLKMGEGLSGQVGRTRAAITIPDLSIESGFQGFWGTSERSGTLVAVPIQYQDKLLGVLTVTHPGVDAIEKVQVKLLSAIADNAALAIRNAQLFERMRLLSTHDELTGLANRRLFRAQLDGEIDRARRFGIAVSLLVIDIDHFKELNDHHGHPHGDAVLCEVAKLLSRHVRKVDSVARVGGEEFMVLLPRTGIDDAQLVANKLRTAICEHLFVGSSDQPQGALTVSIGVSELRAHDDDHGDALIARADQALYVAKTTGRNRVVVNSAP